MTSGLVRKWWQKPQKIVVLQRKVRLIAAHNPEVVGSSPASATKNRRFHHENGGFLNFLRWKRYGSNLLTHTVTHTPIAYSGQGSIKEKLLATKSEKSEKLF